MYLEQIRLQRIKNFTEQAFDFHTEEGSLRGFHVVVGPNASGKSTLLKAMALSLAGPVAGMQLMQGPLGWISRSSHHENGGTAGHVSGQLEAILRPDQVEDNPVAQNGNSIPTRLNALLQWSETGIENSSTTFEATENSSLTALENGPWNESSKGWFAAGYGPLRHFPVMPPPAGKKVPPRQVAVFSSLFHYDASLIDGDRWLRDLKFKALEKGKAAGRLLDQIIQLLNDDFFPHEIRIEEVTSDGVFVRDNEGIILTMEEMSDGCRSAFCLILDIIFKIVRSHGTNEIFSTPREQDGPAIYVVKPGVVLIDELESHLHPTWQSSFPHWVAKHFPNIQFVVTTHSPFILQGAVTGTIHTLHKTEEPNHQATKITGDARRRILLGRAGNILLSAAFRMEETRSSWALEKMERYRILEARESAGSPLTDEERKELENLESDMQLAFDDIPPHEGAPQG